MNTNTRRHRFRLAISAAVILPSLVVRAGTIWDGGAVGVGANDWGLGDNWNDNLTPPTGATVDLTFAGSTRTSPFNNYTSFDDFHSIFFDASAASFNLFGNAIDIFGKIENYSTNPQTVSLLDLAINAGQSGTGEFNPVNGDLTIASNNVFTNGNTLRVYGTNNKTVTFSASTVISQAGHFNVEQASNVVFLGNNTYGGTTNVLAGTLTVGNGGTTGSTGTGTVTVLAGAKLTYNRSDAVTIGQTLNVGGELIKQGTGTLTISGAQTGITGTVAINAGRITMGANNSLGTAPITLNGGTIERNAAGQTVANAISIGAAGGTILGRQVVDDYTVFSGQLTGAGALTVQGLVTLNNNTNTHSGSVAISNASATYLRLTASEVLGNTSAVTMGGANANFRLDGGVTETIGSLAGSGTIFVSNVGGGTNGTLKFGGNNTSTTYTGGLSNNDGQLHLVKQGSGTFTLNPTGTISFQSLTVSNGTVSTSNAAFGANATITLGDADTGANNVALVASTNGITIGRPITVSANGSGTATIGSTGGTTNSTTFSGQLTLNRPTILTGANTDRTTYTGKITGNVGTLTITGGQRTVFDNAAGVNDFVGDLVISGTGTVLQTGVVTQTGEAIPNTSNVTVGAGTLLKFANNAGSTETINGLNGTGIVRRHEGVGGLTTLAIGSAGASGSFGGTLENGAGTLAIRKEGAGTQTISSVSGNTASGGITVNGGVLKFTGLAAFDSGTFNTAQAYNINNSGTLEIAGDWLTKSTSTYNVNAGGTLTFSSPGVAVVGDRSINYVNILNLTDGTVNGPSTYRVGNNTTATHTFSGNLGNTISTGFGMVKNGASQTVNLTVNDGTADADLTVSGVIFDIAPFVGSTLNKQGAGKMVFSAANTYTGPTTITAGTLQVGAGGTTGTLGSGAVTNNSILSINRSNAFTVANVIGGTGVLNNNGTGTVTLTGANTYTGATNANAGVLYTTPAQTGATTVNIADGATFGVKLLSLGTTFSAATLNSGTTTGATIGFDTGALGNPTAAVISTTTFTPTAPTTLRVLGSNITAGTFPLLDYTGSIGGVGFAGLTLALPFRVAGVPVNNTTDTRVDVNITGAETAKWQGNVNGDWDIDPDGGNSAGTFNWKTSLLSTSTRYAQGAVNTDTVTFDDTATGTKNVNLTTTLTPNSLTVDTAATYSFTGTGKLSGATGITKTGTGTLAVTNTGANDFTGTVDIQNGTLSSNTIGGALGAGTSTVLVGSAANAGTLRYTGTTAASTSRALTLGAAGGALSVDDSATTLTASGVISGGALVKNGSGSVLLTAANTYSGGTTVSAGRLQGNTNTAFGTGPITIGDTAANASIYLGQRADITNPVTVSALGSGTVVIGADDSGSGTNASTYAGLITLNRPTTFSGEVLTDRLAIDGQVTGNVGTLTVSGGARTTFLSTLNDFTGDIVITGTGTILQASVATAAETIPNGSSITVNAGAILQLASNGGAETINALNGAGTVRTFPTAAFGGNLILGSANGSGTFSGTLVNGTNPLSLTKVGTGTQTLTGSNTYTGATTVNDGSLIVNGSISGSATTVNAGTLGGNGTVGALTLAGGNLAPGNSAGILNANGNTSLNGGTFTAEINGPTAGTGYDQLNVTGTVNFGGTVQLSLSLGFDPSDDGSQTFTLVANNDIDAISFVDSNSRFAIGANLLEEGESFFIGAQDFAISYIGGSDANDVVLTAIPEPASAVLLLGGLAALGMRRRRK
ncbi:MAG: hypothetical protein RL088_266 [Verrucomicrobiota bacterium]